MALIPDEKVDSMIGILPCMLWDGDPEYEAVGQPYWPERTMARELLDSLRELKACREALREIDRAACVETSDPATGAISSLARARLPEHKEAPDA